MIASYIPFSDRSFGGIFAAFVRVPELSSYDEQPPG